jgi:8-oxo-dGTP diphosphatase
VPTTLTISAVCFTADDHLLTVRKRGTSRFMLPGGKLDDGESPAQAAVREVAEELGIELDEADLVPLGTYREEAANEPDTHVDATIFTAELFGIPDAAREIAELRWTPITAPPADLAPLLARHVLPALRAR